MQSNSQETTRLEAFLVSLTDYVQRQQSLSSRLISLKQKLNNTPYNKESEAKQKVEPSDFLSRLSYTFGSLENTLNQMADTTTELEKII